ncbi:class V chitinase-like [Temnothorax curvispinosus]|uniref:Class V chitinase-like n=1 Tax=Temnothorax curvispinosus TaxID=300111 RepID=A0A6J1Q9L2_9HYME|nr:class V chitinase-like [Temnothorax curvispinosus]
MITEKLKVNDLWYPVAHGAPVSPTSHQQQPRQQRRLNQILTIPSRSKPVHYPRQIAEDIHSYRTKTTAPSIICAISARSRNSPVHLDFTKPMRLAGEHQVQYYSTSSGWNDSKDDKYSKLAGSSWSNRRNFVGYVIRIIEQYGFDGLDLDWEFPVCWQDSENFIGLLEDLSEAFTSRGLLLSIAVSASKIVVNRGYTRLPLLVRHVDWIAVSYDMYYIFMTFR